MKNIILYDWFAMTSKIDTYKQLLNLLCIENEKVNFTENYGLYGYRNRLEYNGISIHYNHWNPESDFPLLEMSGQGCRAFETYSDGNWQRLFDCCLDSENYNVTRIDIAYDDLDGLLDIEKIKTAAESRNYISRSTSGIITNSFKDDLNAISVMFGSRSSEYYMRFYDKAAERGGLDYHWVRCEQVLKHERALEFLKKSDIEIGKRFAGVLLNYLRFVVPSKTETNKSRWNTEKWYTKFLGECEKISLYTKKDVEYNMYRLKSYLQNQCGNSIETFIRCEGLEGLRKLLLEKPSKLTANQQKLVDEYWEYCNTDFSKEWK